MTKRERYLRVLRNESVDELVWAPNIDYWLGVNRAEGSLPTKYIDMSRDDILRSIDAYIWARASGLRTVRDASVTEKSSQDNAARVTELQTPVGTVRQVRVKAEGEHRTLFVAERFVKDLDSLRVMKYVAEATHYEPDYEPTLAVLSETGEDGIVLNQCLSVPFIQFAKSDAGYVNGFYLWMDHRDEVDALLEVYHNSFLQGYAVLADGPADVISTADNMDGTMISPAMFREYATPFYQEAKKIISGKGRIFKGHWCGRTENLLDQVPGCGLDVLEAIVTKPMADIELSDALDLLQGEVVLQGGVPSVLACEEGGSRNDFERYLQETILPLAGRRGFILGMSDNVPPNADFPRIEAVSRFIAAHAATVGTT